MVPAHFGVRVRVCVYGVCCFVVDVNVCICVCGVGVVPPILLFHTNKAWLREREEKVFRIDQATKVDTKLFGALELSPNSFLVVVTQNSLNYTG